MDETTMNQIDNSQEKVQGLNIVMNGITINGPMFDIHDNHHVVINAASSTQEGVNGSATSAAPSPRADAKGASVATTAGLSAPRSLACEQGGKKQSPKQDAVVASSPLEGNERGLSRSKKKTFKERQEFAAVEVAIADLEAEKEAIEEALCTGTLTAEELTRQSIRLSALNEELDEKTMRWLELSEIPD